MVKVFLKVDKSGRGYTAEVTIDDIDDEYIKDWAERCDVGDSRSSEKEPIKYTRIK
jgi:hypothetical protein